MSVEDSRPWERISNSDVREGDVFVGYRYNGKDLFYGEGGGLRVVKKVGNDTYTSYDVCEMVHENKVDSEKFRYVLMYTEMFLLTASRNTKAIDSMFPHKCTFCKTEAYVGFNRIEHRFEQKSCPGV